MRLGTTPGRKAQLVCGAAGLAMAVGSAAAAQTADTTPSGAGAAAVEEVVVTGTRVAREGYTAPTPTTSISRETLENQAAVVLSDVIYQIPSVRPAPNAAQTSQASGNYVALHVGRNTHLLRITMTNFVNKLGADQFVRIHRSTVVNLDCIQEVMPWFHGEHVVKLKDGTELTVGRAFRRRLSDFLANQSQ